MDNKTCLGLNNKQQTGDASVTSLFSKTIGFFCFSFNKRSPEDAAWKTEFFCIRYFSKTKRKSSKSITERCFSCQNNSVNQKISSIMQKMKIGQKNDIRPFCRKAFNCAMCFYVTTRKKTLLMAEILSSLHDGGELGLMNGDNNADGINFPRLWLLLFRIGKTYCVTS